MKNILWVVLWLSLLVSQSSKAYEQEYQVGDTGPNGGVVTSVTVGSVLSDSSTELVGDFLETTDIYTYTETIIEEVENVTYETVQVTEAVVSENLLPDDYTVYGGTHVCTETQCYGMTGADFTTGNQSLGVSGHLYDIDLSDYDDMTQVIYGSVVYSHSSNSSVPDCANTTGDCRDDFAIAIRLYNSGTLVFEKVNQYTGIDWSGSRTYDYTENVSSYTFDSAQLGLAGIDQGWTNGYYGPGFSDYFFKVTYNQISEILNTITSYVEYTTVKNTDEYVYSSEYVPPPPEPVYNDVVIDIDTSFEMEFENFEGDIVSFEIDLVETETGEIEIQMTTFEEDVEVEVEIIELDMEEMIEDLDVEVEVAEVESDSEDAPEPTVETEEEGEQEVVQQSETKEQVAQKIMTKVAEMGDQVALSNIKLAVMAQLGNTQEFQNYSLKTLTDTDINDYLSITIEDQYGMLFQLAQDVTMEDMINAQY